MIFFRFSKSVSFVRYPFVKITFFICKIYGVEALLRDEVLFSAKNAQNQQHCVRFLLFSFFLSVEIAFFVILFVHGLIRQNMNIHMRAEHHEGPPRTMQLRQHPESIFPKKNTIPLSNNTKKMSYLLFVDQKFSQNMFFFQYQHTMLSCTFLPSHFQTTRTTFLRNSHSMIQKNCAFMFVIFFITKQKSTFYTS